MNFFQRLSSRPLANHRNDTARVALTVEDGRWATHQLNTLKHVGINNRIVVEVTLQFQAIQIVILAQADGREATDNHEVIGIGSAATAYRYARRVTQRFFY
ncbi:Uncharacterised protein [Salmonella enterica subsp. enterica serovar Bovismorbificans]|uniref:Uncharacterized protein n=1 Tax=Salmonella enterica subsp. enterica serovar Bovismorbificans TaxID=58097 RepID=A0A655EIN4_SALET|nr:Uncharacterised protein [Salmonella enterica subsp. enterica serovar Bovismorbificans]